MNHTHTKTRYALLIASLAFFLPTPTPFASAATLSATFNDHGEIRQLTWTRPGAPPIHMTFRTDRFAGFSFHVNVDNQWSTQLPLVRTHGSEFALNKDGITYSLAYTITNNVLQVVAKITNDSQRPFSPQRLLVNLGVDTEMAQYPQWNQRFFPTLLRCEKTHFWGYLMRPDGIILAIASPDPIVSWANGYDGGGHRIFTPCLDLLNQDPQPARHPHVNPTLAPGETRQWKIDLVPTDKLADVQPLLSAVAAIPMIALDRPTVEAGQSVRGQIYSIHSPIDSLTVTGPDAQPIPCNHDAQSFSFAPPEPGTYTILLQTADGKIAQATAACRMPWSWYIKQARINAVDKPQKASSHTESWYGLFSGYIARRYFPDPDLDQAIDAKYAELAPLMYDLNTFAPITNPDRIQNHACWVSMLVDRYNATGDIRSLEFASALADFILTKQSSDGAYRDGKSHYTCVVYIAKSIMEVMAAEKPLAEKDPLWKARYDRHAASVRRAIDDLARRLDNIGTEGEATYEDGMISCEYTQLAMYALLQTDPELRQKYLAAAEKIASGHRCLSQLLVPDCRMNGASLRFWESQYDIMTSPDMICSPHGWSAWRLYGLWYLYQLTGKTDYLRDAMNGLASCAQLIHFKTGDLRWAFIDDPCVHATVFEQDPDHPEKGVWNQRIIGEQYMPMISGWYRAQPNTWVTGYFNMDHQQAGGSCDNDVHEIFKCLGEIALTSAYVIQNPDGSLQTWNCSASTDPSGNLTVTPAEPVVSRIHFNLQHPTTVQAHFSSQTRSASLPAGLTWLAPDSTP